MAVGILQELGLTEAGWTFGWNRRKTALGVTVWKGGKPFQVQLSGPLTDLNDRAMMEATVRHEAAHALAGHEAGHGPAWRQACRVTGAVPESCAVGAAKVEPRWQAVCMHCGELRMRAHRLTAKARSRACGRCCDALAGGRWDERFRLRWVDTRAEQVTTVAAQAVGKAGR